MGRKSILIFAAIMIDFGFEFSKRVEFRTHHISSQKIAKKKQEELSSFISMPKNILGLKKKKCLTPSCNGLELIHAKLKDQS